MPSKLTPNRDYVNFLSINLCKMDKHVVEVDCYSGHTYAERPQSFLWQGTKYEIKEIEKAWQEPRERHFQIRTTDNKFFHLWYNERQKEWSLIELIGGEK